MDVWTALLVVIVSVGATVGIVGFCVIIVHFDDIQKVLDKRHKDRHAYRMEQERRKILELEVQRLQVIDHCKQRQERSYPKEEQDVEDALLRIDHLRS